ncbi:MAG: SLC13/DASS family transporter [Alcanivoracaceae bacterium]|nr:SLC13/DASS family transporter [Alcanivoracaceae bacterium]
MNIDFLRNNLPYLLFIAVSAIVIYGSQLSTKESHTLFITLVTASLWITEKIPIPVSSLIPIAAFPLFGILDSKMVAQSYGSPLILLLLGGFMLSMAMSHTKTHRLIANKIIQAIGTSSQAKVLLSFMVTASLLSMWISNTATTLMLLPIALAILEKNTCKNFAIVLLLGIAYAASIGGIATPIGTPPNLILIQTMQQAGMQEIGFISWMKQVLPILFIILPVTYFYLKSHLENKPINYKIEDLSITSSQKKVLLVFFITAVLWMTRVEPFGGWKSLLNLPFANDASVVLLAVVILFTLKNEERKPLITWDAVSKIPWGILLLFAGGITIATAFKETGLSESIANNLMFLNNFPTWAIVGFICLFVTFLTEVTSNTATTAVLMPILLSTAQALNIDPMALMLPATISASFAFMMPVATAPNAIIFSSGHVPIKKMMRIGLFLNLIGAFILTVYFSIIN